MHARLTALVLVSACHRVFGVDLEQDAPGDAAADAGAKDASTDAPWTRWGAPQDERLTLTYNDDDTSLTADRLTVFLCRIVGTDGEILMAQRTSVADDFSAPEVVSEVSIGGPQGAPRVLPDGLTLMYSFNDPADMPDMGTENFVATRPSRTAAWTVNGAIAGIGSVGAEQGPTIDESGTQLVFSSDRAGGAGRFDLYFSSRPSTAVGWSAPVPMTQLNTPTDDTGAWLSPDALALYFHSGPGPSTDIYVATRSSRAAAFGLAVPVTEVNTPATEIDPWTSPDGRYLYFVRQDPTTLTTKLMYATRE